MSVPFVSVHDAALAVLNCGAELKAKEGQFLGGLAYQDYDPTPKQLKWLIGLLDRHGLAPLADGVGA